MKNDNKDKDIKTPGPVEPKPAEDTSKSDLAANEAAEAANAATNQREKEIQEAASRTGGVTAVEKAPPAAVGSNAPKPVFAGGKDVSAQELSDHPVEVAKANAREAGIGHLNAVHGDGTNLTPTQRRAMEDQEREIKREAQAAPEPARGVEHSVGTERKGGMRTAMPESERAGLDREVKATHEFPATKAPALVVNGKVVVQ